MDDTMIFGRKKKQAEKDADESVETTTVDETSVDDTSADAADTETGAADPDADLDTAEDDDELDSGEDDDEDDDTDAEDAEDEWAALDLSKDWREDGPFDINEVDLEADDIERLDFGALVITPIPECELRLQVAEETQQIVSALIVKDESALELSAFAAPRSPGMWAEIREQIVEQTEAAGGTADSVEGPFGTELVRNVPVQTPDGQVAFQPSRTWVAQGPRWLLRGVLFGQAALSDQSDDELVGPFLDAFSDVVVRRGDAPMPVGDVLALTLPPELQQAEPESAQ
ncbi:DUF3710 domain-containing protein [Enemella evansiae]|uniref:DUF3710 domain-containing protein n=1 Tax=Enemella evansiae TaxID=2016499 RepID=UPI001414D3F4|nr:DUF3710 domain-containing protein [Enemella evansiae]